MKALSIDGSQTSLRKTVSTRDATGMTLLQRCVLSDRTNVVDFILETDPTLLDAKIMVFAVQVENEEDDAIFEKYVKFHNK